MMTKAILAKKLKKSGLSYRDALLYLDMIIETIIETLSNGQKIQFKGLGTFNIQITPEKTYPSLMSGSQVIPAHGRITFRPSEKLRLAVWKVGKTK
jgi:nucleoid DNA-binding protein